MSKFTCWIVEKDGTVYEIKTDSYTGAQVNKLIAWKNLVMGREVFTDSMGKDYYKLGSTMWTLIRGMPEEVRLAKLLESIEPTTFREFWDKQQQIKQESKSDGFFN